ncbi:hypothetical protein NMG60_11018076 [Bertholletia excelsa]
MAADDVPCCDTMFWVYLFICVTLVAFAGLMSGLTLGLMSLSLVDLEVLTKAGECQDRKNAEKILPTVKNQNLLLCTLLVCNSMAMEALPIFLDGIMPSWGAILISVTLILAFGEVISLSLRLCSRYGLSIGAKLLVLVRLLVILVFPMAYPISKLLDLLLGKRHSALLRRAELKNLEDMHGNEAGKGGELTHDETMIISGALGLSQKTAKDAMTPISEIFSLELKAKLDEDALSMIISKGHSRVPVYSGSQTNIIGLILVKNLIKCRPEDETPIRSLTIRQIPRVQDNLPLYDVLNQFQKGHSHMAVVVKKEDGNTRKEALDPLPDQEEVIGIITMEDVLEELLQEEILDETDEYVDVHNKIKINMLPSMQPPSRSLGVPSCNTQRTPMASPLYSSNPSPVAPYHYNPVTHLPISPYIQSPFTRPTLFLSPGKSIQNSPAGSAAVSMHSSSSPLLLHVSRNSYAKLRKPGGF